MFSPSVLKREALTTGTTVIRGDFQVSPEGLYTLRGQRCTLNDAIIYAGAAPNPASLIIHQLNS